MRHLMAQHGGELRGVVGKCEQPARDVELAVRQREGVDRRRVEDGRLVSQVRSLGGRDQPVNRLGEQRFELRILIGAAVGCEDARMLALGRLRGIGARRLRQADLRRAQAADIGAAREQQRKKRRRDQPACRSGSGPLPGRSPRQGHNSARSVVHDPIITIRS
jgi:hypothetical protein